MFKTFVAIILGFNIAHAGLFVCSELKYSDAVKSTEDTAMKFDSLNKDILDYLNVPSITEYSDEWIEECKLFDKSIVRGNALTDALNKIKEENQKNISLWIRLNGECSSEMKSDADNNIKLLTDYENSILNTAFSNIESITERYLNLYKIHECELHLAPKK